MTDLDELRDALARLDPNQVDADGLAALRKVERTLNEMLASPRYTAPTGTPTYGRPLTVEEEAERQIEIARAVKAALRADEVAGMNAAAAAIDADKAASTGRAVAAAIDNDWAPIRSHNVGTNTLSGSFDTVPGVRRRNGDAP